MEFGTIESISVGQNLDSGENVRLARVNVIGEDTVTVEMPFPEGDEFVPGIGDTVYYEEVDSGFLVARCIQTTQAVDPTLLEGERELFSRLAGMRSAKFRLKADGTLVMNDGTDFGVRFNALESALNDLIDDMNVFFAFVVAHSHTSAAPGSPTVGTAADATAVPPVAKPTASEVSLDMSDAKVPKVKL